jgi:hypothetical protein
MQKNIALLMVLAITAGSLAGCSQRIGDFTVISTKNVDIGGKYKKMEGRYKGEDGRGVFLGIPLGQPNLKTAVDNCIESGNGELITNAVIDASFWTAIVWGEQKYTVTGDVWTKASMSDLQNPGIDLYELQGGQKGYTLMSTTDPSRAYKVDYLASR